MEIIAILLVLSRGWGNVGEWSITNDDHPIPPFPTKHQQIISYGMVHGKKLTGNHRFSHDIWKFPVFFPLNQSIDHRGYYHNWWNMMIQQSIWEVNSLSGILPLLILPYIIKRISTNGSLLPRHILRGLDQLAALAAQRAQERQPCWLPPWWIRNGHRSTGHII